MSDFYKSLKHIEFQPNNHKWNVHIICTNLAFAAILRQFFLSYLIPRVESNLSLHHSQTSSFGIQGGICEPQACGNMLDEAHGLSILYLWNAHSLNITLLSHVHLLLLRGTRRKEGVGDNHREANEIRNHNIKTDRNQTQETRGSGLTLTFEIRKQKADSLVLALSGSTTNRPFSSSRHRYRPVVMWRIRKDCPHFMWLPLQLQADIE